MRSKLILSAFLAAFCASAFAIVPQPLSRTNDSGAFVIMPSTTIAYTDPALRPLVVYMLDYVGVRHVSQTPPQTNAIVLSIDNGMEPEEYRLTIEGTRIGIAGGGYGGVFNGIQTLFQLMPSSVYTKKCRLPATITCCRIEDRPQFEYRGFMLDVVRTWADVDKVKHYIDILSYHKINKLHLVLSNDEGWRIEIKSHPELTEIGAFRGGSSPIKSVYGKWGERYGGYYTRRQMLELIDYARTRNIEIIPEIDLPGHSRAMAQIHPEILCDYKPDYAATGGYEYRSAWCVSKESNYELLDDILGEICELFPSRYIHVGGDEVDLSQWKRCPDCKAFLAARGYSDAHKLEDRFMSRITDILESHGKLPAVWNEAINGGELTENARVHGWEGVEQCLKSTAEGFRTVVMPGKFFYFDMRQSPHEAGHNWAAVFDLEQCYSFDFGKCGFSPEQMACVEGVEAAFFSELYVSHEPEKLDYLEYQTFPRICALSEIAWGKNGDTDGKLYDRLREKHFDRMAAMGIRFRLSPPAVKYENGRLSASVGDNSIIYYTVEHSGKTERYIRPFKTDTPARYLFWSEYRTGISPQTGIAEHYRTITPPFRISSSMGESRKVPFRRVTDYKGPARTDRTCRSGDWILYEFDTPVACREMELTTGHAHLPKCIFDSGYVETSTDGTAFERVADLHAGCVLLVNPAPVKAVRIVSTGDGNGTPYVVVQPPKIKPLL